MPNRLESPALEPEKAWRATYHQLEILLEPAQFSTWLRGTFFHSYEEGVFIIAVNSPFALQMLQQRLYRNVRRVLRDVCGEAVDLRFRLGETENEAAVTTQPAPETPLLRMISRQNSDNSQTRAALHSRVGRPEFAFGAANELSEHFTFSRFLVSRENELLFNATCAVAEDPGQRYSPLLLYGGVGLGKTHLLQAIAHEIQRQGLRALYIPSEIFTNDLITAIRKKSTALFRAKYRQADALLVDDIQFIAGKESTQLEFFHTFNELVNGGRQVVLASDRHPQQLIGLQDRLVSRFSGGLVLDIQPPEYETRLAILQMWAREEQLALTEAVSAQLAERAEGNIRNLRGLFQRVLAQARLQNQPLTLTQVRHMARNPARAPEISPRDIITLVATCFDLQPRELYGKRRSASINHARQIAMYLIRELTPLSLPQIGHCLGKRSHTTILHGCRKISARLPQDAQLQDRLREMEAELRRGQ